MKSFEEVWKEQEELNKIGQDINETQAHRLYSYGYNQAINRFEKYFIDKQRVKEAIKKLDKELCYCHDRRTTADWVIWFKKEFGLED
jgi:hypothetical protein